MMKRVLSNVRRFFKYIVTDKYEKLSYRKLIVYISILNVLLQTALIRTHNQAAYVVYSPVAIISFFYLISTLMNAMNAIRLSEKIESFIFNIVFQIISITMGSLYIVRILQDSNYLSALAGQLSNSRRVVFAVQNSVYLLAFGIFTCVITLVLTFLELKLKHIGKKDSSVND